MFQKRVLSFLTAIALLAGLTGTALAAETDCDSIYCFTAEDFSAEPLAGICITQLPDESLGTVMLGQRRLRPGDILAADQLAQMTFAPVRSETDQMVSISYLPIFEDRVDKSATMTIAVQGKENKAPAAEDFAAETYKNLPIDGQLKVKDPENEPMTYAVTRNPKRGTVTIREDGTFTYTPKKNKVGIDSFVYTATDPAGNVSREATVTITIVKPTDSSQYTDTLGKDCRFAAEWMKNTGIFVGEKLDGNACFSPDRAVTRGEFVTMLVNALDIPREEHLAISTYTDEIPGWLQPYLAAAIRSGLTAGLPDAQTFGPDVPITGAEAALMIQNALDFASPLETMAVDAPQWAAPALSALLSQGIALDPSATLTRGQAAVTLYQVRQLSENAPGMNALRGLD